MHIHTRNFAKIGGWLMIIVGALAFVPALQGNTYLLPALQVNNSYGMFLGYFPMNILNKLAVIALGIVGVVASMSPDVITSVKYSRFTTIVMAVLTVMGLIPSLNTFFGYMPLFRGMIVLNAVLAVVAGYYGYVVPARIYKREARL